MFFNKTIYCNKGFDYSIFGMCFNVNVLCALHFRTSLIALHVQRKTFTDKLSCRCATVIHLMETTGGVAITQQIPELLNGTSRNHMTPIMHILKIKGSPQLE